MLYAVMSDIHANPQALERALADAREQGAEKFICLGDVVGYGPDAVGAVALARASFDVVLMGNHDAATAGLIPAFYFRPEARAGVYRHGHELSEDALAWLRGLPYVHRSRTFLAAHGSIAHPDVFPYISTEEAVWEALRAMGRTPLLFVGHTHASLWIEARAGSAELTAARTATRTLVRGCRSIVNVGSVGYPRNEPESVYALYDSRRRVVTWRRLPFDYAGYFAQMEAKGIYIAPWLRENALAGSRRD